MLYIADSADGTPVRPTPNSVDTHLCIGETICQAHDHVAQPKKRVVKIQLLDDKFSVSLILRSRARHNRPIFDQVRDDKPGLPAVDDTRWI